MNNKIIIIAGDPNSINSEIIFKTWKKSNKKIRNNIVVIGNLNLLANQSRKMNFKISLAKITKIDDNTSRNKLKVINVPLKFNNPFKVSKLSSSRYIIKSLNLAHDLAINRKVKGFINCPINKNLIKNSKKIGVTEFLASKSKIFDNSEVMMIYNKNLSVVPITTHLKIKQISSKIKSKLIVKKIMTLNKYYKEFFNIKPKIGILGLNPHNGEFEKDSEEVKTIIPVISYLKKLKYNVQGPLAADTVFIDQFKKFNVIVGMYHDQVLGPFKTLFKFDAINITLGLKYVRVSPDHGPALDLVKKNKANYSSLLQCLKFINNLK